MWGTGCSLLNCSNMPMANKSALTSPGRRVASPTASPTRGLSCAMGGDTKNRHWCLCVSLSVLWNGDPGSEILRGDGSGTTELWSTVLLSWLWTILAFVTAIVVDPEGAVFTLLLMAVLLTLLAVGVALLWVRSLCHFVCAENPAESGRLASRAFHLSVLVL